MEYSIAGFALECQPKGGRMDINIEDQILIYLAII